MGNEATTAGAPAAPVAPVPEGAEDFDSVFNALMAADEGGTTSETPTETPAADGTSVPPQNADQPDQSGNGPDGAAQPPAAGGNPAAPDGTGLPAADGTNANSGNPPATGEVDWKARAQELEAKLAAAAAQPPAAPAAPAAPPAAPEPPPLYSTAEQQELDTLVKEWPESARLFNLLARQLEVNLINYTFSEVGKVLAPLQQSVSTLTGNEHIDAIYRAHADYDAAYAPCMEWISKQPAFLKAAYENVVKAGTADDVVALMQKFKDETKWGAAATPPAAPATAPTPVGTQQPNSAVQSATANLSDAAKQAALAIGAVGTKRGEMQGAVDPSDFDGAWLEALASTK